MGSKEENVQDVWECSITFMYVIQWPKTYTIRSMMALLHHVGVSNQFYYFFLYNIVAFLILVIYNIKWRSHRD